MKSKESNLEINYPEMCGNSEAPIQAENTSLTFQPYRVTCKEPINMSRGISYNGIVSEIGANNCKNKRAGWHKYYMTKKAFEKFCETHKVTLNCLLD